MLRSFLRLAAALLCTGPALAAAQTPTNDTGRVHGPALAPVVQARIEDAGGVTRIPFDLVNNHIHIDGRINDVPVRFLVDTGGVNLLTPAAAKRLGLATEGGGAAVAAGAGAERVEVRRTGADELRVGAAVFSKPTFLVIDMVRFESMEGAAVDGLVGYEVFRRFGVQVDYENRMLTLSEPERFVPPAGATVLPFEMHHHIPVIEGSMDGLPLRLGLDTGARTSMTMHSPFVREHQLEKRYDNGPESVIGWGVGGPVRGRPTQMGALQLGALRVEGIVGNLFSGDRGALANPQISANLGGGVLRRFTVAFDYRAKQVHLLPNADYARADQFDRSGLWLMKDGAALEIGDVAPQSAAQLAGLRVGDRIVEIDGAAVPTRSLGDWRALLRETPAGTRLRIRFERAGQSEELTLTLADRIVRKS